MYRICAVLSETKTEIEMECITTVENEAALTIV